MSLPNNFCGIDTFLRTPQSTTSATLINNNPYRYVWYDSQQMCFISAIYKILADKYTAMTWAGIATDRASVLRTVSIWGAELDINLPLILATTESGNIVGDWYDLPSGYTNHVITDHEWQELVAFCNDIIDPTQSKDYATLTWLSDLEYYQYTSSGLYTQTINPSLYTPKIHAYWWHSNGNYTGGHVRGCKIEFPQTGKLYYVETDTGYESRVFPYWGRTRTGARSSYGGTNPSNYVNSDGYLTWTDSKLFCVLGYGTSSGSDYLSTLATSNGMVFNNNGTLVHENYNATMWNASGLSATNPMKIYPCTPDYANLDATYSRTVNFNSDATLNYFYVDDGETELYTNFGWHEYYLTDYDYTNIAMYCVTGNMRWERNENGYKINYRGVRQW